MKKIIIPLACMFALIAFLALPTTGPSNETGEKVLITSLNAEDAMPHAAAMDLILSGNVAENPPLPTITVSSIVAANYNGNLSVYAQMTSGTAGSQFGNRFSASGSHPKILSINLQQANMTI